MAITSLSLVVTFCLLQSTERWPPTHEIPEPDAHAALSEAGATYIDGPGWFARAQRIRTHLAATLELEKVPSCGPVRATRLQRREMNGYAVENVQLETMPGFYLGANLYTPLGMQGPFPVVLAPHGHKRADDSGAEGRFQPNYQKLCATLARAGAMVLSWDMVGWGETTWLTHRRPESTALQTFNTIRAIDFAEELPNADPSRIGITGSSGGGTQTFLATALDQRITVAAPAVMVSAHFFGGCSCESGLPIHDDGDGLRTSNVEIAALAAPRPLLLISVGGDWTKNTPEIEFPHIKRIYSLLGATQQVANAHFAEEDHDYGTSKRDASIRFMAKHLQLDLTEVTDLDGSIDDTHVLILPRQDLCAFNEQHPLPENALKGDSAIWEAFLNLPRQSK